MSRRPSGVAAAAIKKFGQPMTGLNYYLGLYGKYLIDNEETPPPPPY